MKEYIVQTIIFIHETFFVTTPSLFLYTAISFKFWGLPLQQHWKKILLFSLLTPSLSFIIEILILPSKLVFISHLTLIIFIFIVFLVLFRSLHLVTRFKIVTFAFVSYTLIDLITGMLVLQFNLFDKFPATLVVVIVTWPVYIVLATLLYFMHNRQWSLGQRINDYFKHRNNNNMLYLVVLLVIQFITLMLSLIAIYDSEKTFKPLHFMLYFSIILGFLIVFVILRVISQVKDHAVRLTQKVYIEEVNQLFTTIRGQRHDFLNHVQVISSFIKLGKTLELERYIYELVDEIKEINNYIEIGHPALGALIQSKVISSVDQKIDFRYQFTDLNQLSLGMKSIDIVKITGNLIDNAMDEVLNLPVEERWVELKCWIEEDHFNLTVRNPGQPITKEKSAIIFVSNYSTKNKDEHSGIGLSIVKERVEYYKGTVGINSCAERGVEFTVRIPLRIEDRIKKQPVL